MSPIDLQTMSDIPVDFTRAASLVGTCYLSSTNGHGRLRSIAACMVMADQGEAQIARMPGCVMLIMMWLLPPAFLYLVYKQYSSAAVRTVAAGWTMIWLILFLSLVIADTGSRQDVSTSSSDSDPPAAADVEDNADPEAQSARSPEASAASVQLSDAAREMESLWEELKGFRSNPQFHRLGFGRASPFGDWRRRLNSLADRSALDLMAEIEIAPGALIAMANDYMNNGGRETELTRHHSDQLEAVFDPEPVGEAEGRTTAHTDGCRHIDLVLESTRLLEADDIRESYELLERADCHALPRGAVVGPIERRKVYRYADGSGERGHVLVETTSGRLWLPEDEIAY